MGLDDGDVMAVGVQLTEIETERNQRQRKR